MIHFFRRIREQLLGEGKTGKYLKYAIGEIVLVVIGILIALSINNWNQKQIEKKQMNSFLLSVIGDLKSDTLQYGSTIQFFNTLVNKKQNILELSNFDNLSVENLYDAIIPRISNYEINSTTFNKITNSGITQISKNESLSKKIYGYYTVGASFLDDLIVWDRNSSTTNGKYWHNDQNLFELNLEAYDLKDSEGIINFQDEITRKQGLSKLLSEPKGRNHLKLDYVRKKRISNNLKDFKQLATKLIAEIEKELKKN